MSRSVVRAGTSRCEQCQLPPRWCVCLGLPLVDTPLRIDILTHEREQWRPTSTGRLIERVVKGSRRHVYHRSAPHVRSEVPDPDRELWILHPRGEPLPSASEPAPDVSRVQVLLLDGSWTEAGDMLRTIQGWGRPVSLSLLGESRYWLRDQQKPGHLSTVEALLGVYRALGLREAETRLSLHFELLVYASLRARGKTPLAAAYLESSPIRSALPDLLRQLHERR